MEGLSFLLKQIIKTFLFVFRSQQQSSVPVVSKSFIAKATPCSTQTLHLALLLFHGIESDGPLGIMQHWRSSCVEFYPLAAQHDPYQYYAQCKRCTFPDWDPTDYYSIFKAYQQLTCSLSSSQVLPEDTSQQLQTTREHMVILDVLLLFAVVSAKLQAHTQNEVNQKKIHILMLEEHFGFGQCC